MNQWKSLGIIENILESMKILWNQWKSMGINENPSESLNIRGNQTKSLGINENPWESMKILGNQWNSLEINENPWESMTIFGNQWKSLEINGNYNVYLWSPSRNLANNHAGVSIETSETECWISGKLNVDHLRTWESVSLNHIWVVCQLLE